MNKIFTFLVCLGFITLSASAQNCGGDSLVILHAYEFNDYDFFNTYRVDSFDLTSGIVYTRTTTDTNSTLGTQRFSQNTFTRHMISYNANYDTIQYRTLTGNGSGFDNNHRIEFTYNASSLPFTRDEYQWNGLSWDLIQNETWTYNINDRITSYTLSDTTGNILRKSYGYSSGQNLSMTTQKWVGGNWVNDERFLYTYDLSNTKDSIFIQDWDSLSSSWTDSLSSAFDSTGVSDLLIDTLVGPPWAEIIGYKIDTLGNPAYSYHENQSFPMTSYYYYKYFNNHLKLTYLYQDFSAYSHDEGYIFDNRGWRLRESSSNQSSISISGNAYYYDSLARIYYSNYGIGSNVHDANIDSYYSYADGNSISVKYVPVNKYFGLYCQGDTLQVRGTIAGGCGPYSISWSPSINLSSDTVAEPKILLSDSIVYTITVSDTAGHQGTTTFAAIPEYYAWISFDSSLCSGCPVVLTAISNSGSSYEWYRNDTIIPFASTSSYTAVSSGSYKVRVFDSFCSYTSDSIQLTLSEQTRISGNIFLDMDSDCVKTPADRDLDFQSAFPYFVKLERLGYSVLITPDSTGYFDVPMDTGMIFVSTQQGNSLLIPSCPDSGVIPVYVPSYGDTISGIDLFLKPRFNCHRLKVGVSTGNMRACSPITISVRYYNEGTVDESNPIIDVALPPEIINPTSSIPFVVQPDNRLRFSLPPLASWEWGAIPIHAQVDCDSLGLVNYTLCIAAEIQPKDFCSLLPDSTWDGSNVRVTSYCQNDSAVCFILRNEAGQPGGNMVVPSTWRLYADNQLYLQGTFQLADGADTTLCFASDGRTFRLEADQTPGFPTVARAQASIERCGILPIGQNYSLRKIITAPADNYLPFYYTYCSVVRNSFDPNIKTVQPEGFGSDHIVEKGERLYYRIDFQNTGNDTAYDVRVVDEFPAGLFDIASINLLASSHPCTYSLDGLKLTWQFNSIFLPDSATDEPGSQGYVEFSVLPRQSLPNGFPVTNRAKIYFDNNTPVTTPSVSNRICQIYTPEISIHYIDTVCPGDSIAISADVLAISSIRTISWYINDSLYAINNTILKIPWTDFDSIRAELSVPDICATAPAVFSNTLLSQFQKPVINYVAPNLNASIGISYQWYLNDSIIPGAISQAYTPIFSGNYTVEILDTLGCYVRSDEYYFYNTGMNEFMNGVMIYPNPATNFIFVSGINGNYTLELSDITGKSIITLRENKDIKIGVAHITPGIYFMRIKTKDTNISKRVILMTE